MKGRRVAVVAFSCLIAVGVLRPVLPELLRVHWAAVVVSLAAVAAGVQLIRARDVDSRHELWLSAVFAFVLAALYLQPQRVASDGIFYFAPLHSLIVDLDLDFENEYRVLGAEPGYFNRTETGRLPNNYSIGPAILWTPFYLVAHALAYLGLYRPTGFGYPYFTAVATATAIAGFAGVVFLYRLVSAYSRKRIAFTATLFVWLASFHVWYMVFEPSMSHAMAMASTTGFFLLTHEGVRGPKSYAVMGLAAGVVALMRWQNVIFLPVALLVSSARYGWPKPREIVAGAAAFVAVVSPQLLYWKTLYGSYLLIPQGGGYIDWAHPKWNEVLFSSRHGLLSWAPILWLGVLGYPGFLRRAPVFGGGLLAATLGAWYVNASVYDWWAGASYGSRRFDAALPAFALGVAVTLGWLVRHVSRRPLTASAALLLPFVVWNALLMGIYFRGAIPPDGAHSWRQAGADGVELLHRAFGYPPSWPAAIPETLLAGRPLSTYDLSGSLVLSHNVDIRMGDNDGLHLGRGWSLPERRARETFRAVVGNEAEIYVALNEPAPYTLMVEGMPGGRATLRLNGRELAPLTVSPEGRARLSVPMSFVRKGLNELVLARDPSAPLAVSRVLWTRPGEFEAP